MPIPLSFALLIGDPTALPLVTAAAPAKAEATAASKTTAASKAAATSKSKKTVKSAPPRVGMPAIGTHVYANWLGRGSYYPGTITLREGEKVRIQYEDGDQETTNIGALRVVADKVEVPCVNGEAIFAAMDPAGRTFYPVTIVGLEN